MHRFLALLLLPAMVMSVMVMAAWAEDVPPTPTVDLLRAPAVDTPKDARQPTKHARVTWEARFAQANAAHDGHLSLAEAKTSYKTIAQHFKEIDIEGKGYVTENDVRAWRALQSEVRHAPRQDDDPLRPRDAFQRHPPDQRPAPSHTMLLRPAERGQC